MPSLSVVDRRRAAGILASISKAGSGGGGTGSGSGPSGVAMPLTAPSGWVPWFRQDFLTDCIGSNFLATYGGAWDQAAAAAGDGRVNSYPRSYFDTRSKSVAGTVDGYYGRYDPANLSCSGGVMKMHMWWDASDTAGNSTLPATPAGKLSCCAPVPRISADTDAGNWGYLKDVRMSVRCRVVIRTTRATSKVAWLNWPHNNHSTSQATMGIPDSTGLFGFRGGDGECDFPEQDGGSVADCFVHKENAKGTDDNSTPIYGNKQTKLTSTVDFFDGNWHTWTTTRLGGSYNATTDTWVGQLWIAEVDGVQVGSTLTTRVPATKMRHVLQSESTLDSSVALNHTVDYDIEVDWILYDVPG